jgi:hypothetical protein
MRHVTNVSLPPCISCSNSVQFVTKLQLCSRISVPILHVKFDENPTSGSHVVPSGETNTTKLFTKVLRACLKMSTKYHWVTRIQSRPSNASRDEPWNAKKLLQATHNILITFEVFRVVNTSSTGWEYIDGAIFYCFFWGGGVHYDAISNRLQSVEFLGVEQWIWRDLEGSGRCFIEERTRHFSGVTKDKHDKLVMIADYQSEIRNSRLPKALQTDQSERFAFY